MATHEAGQSSAARRALGADGHAGPQATTQAINMRILPDVGNLPETITVGEPTLVDLAVVNEGDSGNMAVDMMADDRYKWGTGGFIDTGAWRTTTATIFRRGVSTLTFRAGELDFDNAGRIVANPVHDKHEVEVTARSLFGVPVETVAAGAAGFAVGVFGTALATDQIQLPELR